MLVEVYNFTDDQLADLWVLWVMLLVTDTVLTLHLTNRLQGSHSILWSGDETRSLKYATSKLLLTLVLLLPAFIHCSMTMKAGCVRALRQRLLDDIHQELAYGTIAHFSIFTAPYDRFY